MSRNMKSENELIEEMGWNDDTMLRLHRRFLQERDNYQRWFEEFLNDLADDERKEQ